jgi:glycosyltransferase involved in cell wall biosynthesis
MRVILVSNTAPEDKMGGLPRYARELAGALERAGAEATLLVKRVNGSGPAVELGGDGVRIIRHPVPAKTNPLFSVAYPLYTARGVLGPVRALRGPDTVIHAHFAVTALPLAMTGMPYVYTFHAPVWRELLDERQDTYHLPTAFEQPAVVGLRLAERLVVARARRTFVLSEFMRGHLCELAPPAGARAERLPGGIDLEKFAPAAVGRAGVEAPLLFTARRLTPRTGVDRLVRALPDILAAHPAATLAIAGVGEMLDRLRRLAGELGVAERVRFVGGLSDAELVDWYRRATVVVMPSVRLEGFGLTIAEALACETPVIGTPVGAVPELLGGLDPSLLAEDNSAPALARAVNRLLDQPDRLREAGVRGRALVAADMGWDAVAKRYLEAYRDVLGAG